MDKITILIADDSAPFRDGMRAMLRRETDLALLDEATTGPEAAAWRSTCSRMWY